MGLLQNGEWVDQWYDTKSNDGRFKREESKVRGYITPDGGPGPDGQKGFKAESGRYHLYVSYACPWAHRALIFRQLKDLKSHITVSVVSPVMLENGWDFKRDEGSSGDHLFDFNFLHQIYTRHQKDYSGRVTVPVLWDKETNQMVNNESSEIIRMFNQSFNEVTLNHTNFYPDEHLSAIDEINEKVYHNINNGVYKTGFATKQKAYEKEYDKLFKALDDIEAVLSGSRYLIGNVITEADWRLFTTLIRFDAVYHGHFKCNKKRIEDYPNISNYVRELYQWPRIAETVDFEHIKKHYYFSHTMINPNQIIPVGPDIDYLSAHNRNELF